MKKKMIGLFAGLAVMTFAGAAQAELLTVSFDLPVTYGFADSAEKTSGTPSGSKISLNFVAFPVGLAVENYTVTTESAKEITFTMTDFFYTAPIPVINLVVGLGIGTATYDSVTALTNDNASLTQFYVSLGFPIFPLVDVHLGYHSVTGTGDIIGTGTSDLVLDGNMLSLGFLVGF